MRFVIMLGALALLALSATAEDQDKALDLAGKDILIREVRDATVGKKKRKSKKSGRRRTSAKKDKKTKGKGQSQRRKGKGKVKVGGSRKNGGGRKGSAKNNNGNRKKGKGTRRTRKGGQSPARRRNTRQDTCAMFYNKENTTAVRDFRYARNQIQKAKRAKKRVDKLDKLTEKAASAFLAGAAFYKGCSDPRAPALYDALSQCNVTAANACNPASLKNTTDYRDIEVCITALETTMNSSENCLSKGFCGSDGTCAYDPIGMGERTCDYIQFDKDVAKRLNKNCTDSDVVGSFTYCNNLLKDNFDVASNCSWCPLVTTLAPSAGRLRKNLNIWNV